MKEANKILKELKRELLGKKMDRGEIEKIVHEITGSKTSMYDFDDDCSKVSFAYSISEDFDILISYDIIKENKRDFMKGIVKIDIIEIL